MQKIIHKKSPKNKKKKDRIKISKGSPEIIIKSSIGLNSQKTIKSKILNQQLTEISKNINFSVIQNKNKLEIIKGDTVGLQKIKNNDKQKNNKAIFISQKCLDENFSTENDFNINDTDNKTSDLYKIILTDKKEPEKISPRKTNFTNLRLKEKKLNLESLKNEENCRNKIIRLAGEENNKNNLNNEDNSKNFYSPYRKYRSNKCSPNRKNSDSFRDSDENSLNNKNITKHIRIINNKDEPLSEIFKRCEVIKITRNKKDDCSNENNKKIGRIIKGDENVEFLRNKKKIIPLGKLKPNRSEEKLDNSFGVISNALYQKFLTKDDEIEDETFKGSIRNKYKRQKNQNSQSKSKENTLK